MSARCIELRDVLVAAINAADVLPSGVTAVGRLFASLKAEDVTAEMQAVVVPGETAIERASRDAMQYDETAVVALQVRAYEDADKEAALLVYANVTTLLAGTASSLLGGEYELVELERAAHYDSQLIAQDGIVRTLIKATYRSIG